MVSSLSTGVFKTSVVDTKTLKWLAREADPEIRLDAVKTPHRMMQFRPSPRLLIESVRLTGPSVRRFHVNLGSFPVVLWGKERVEGICLSRVLAVGEGRPEGFRGPSQ